MFKSFLGIPENANLPNISDKGTENNRHSIQMFSHIWPAPTRVAISSSDKIGENAEETQFSRHSKVWVWVLVEISDGLDMWNLDEETQLWPPTQETTASHALVGDDIDSI